MRTVVINERDNVGVALVGDEKIPSGHKLALRDIASGEPIIKYGEVIGRATADIAAGEWVHTHNLKSHLDEAATYSYEPKITVPETRRGSFLGYRRKHGRAGIRNEIYIIPTVGCVNGVCTRLANEAREHISGTIDGIYALTHQFGCSQLGCDGENIKKLLCSVALNPNASFVLFVGLGCENNGIEGIRSELSPYERDNIAYLNCQDVTDEQECGMRILLDFIKRASPFVFVGNVRKHNAFHKSMYKRGFSGANRTNNANVNVAAASLGYCFINFVFVHFVLLHKRCCYIIV